MRRGPRRPRIPGLHAAAVALFALATAVPARAAPCATEAPDAQLTGAGECLVLRTFGAPAAGTRPDLVVVLHGDVSGGGPARYHFAIAAALAADNPRVVSVAVVRPGYDDGDGRQSTGTHHGRIDSYSAANIDAVAGVVARLKAHHAPRRTILVGHSGGAATAGVILGRHPGLADGAVLVACPCNISQWLRARGRSPWIRSESPSDWVAGVPAATRVVAITGAADDLTAPFLAEAYVEQLAALGIAARVEILGGATHNGAFRDPAMARAVAELIAAP
ncbi:MAG: hypothetical protein JNK67_05385 [Alphaproteobacteria bacterium]|nr:hypothetical protein [Alphaproteobacteria bacterium]